MGGHPWHTHRVTTGCSVWLGPKKLRAPRPRSPVRPMGFLGWTSLLSWPPATGRADPRGLRGPSEALGDRGLSWKRKGCPWEQKPGPLQTGEVLCPRDCARGRGGRRGQGRHPEVSHGCGHRQGSVVGGTRPGGPEPGTQTRPCSPHPGTSTDTPGSVVSPGPAPGPVSPYHILSKTTCPHGGGPGDLGTKTGGKAHHPCHPWPTV